MQQKITKITVTPKEVETLFGIPRGSLANMRWAKKGPRFYKQGRKIFYFLSEFEAWIRSNPCQTIDSMKDN
jgi:hypothetical protein